MLFDGDAAPVVADAEAAVHVDLDVNVPRVPGERFIDAVINQLINEMMQSLGAGVADVHTGPLTDVRGVAEDLHVLRSVIRGGGSSIGDRQLLRGSLGERHGYVIHTCILSIISDEL